MTVIDIRDELHERHIEIIEITDDYIYYAEKKYVNDIDAIYILQYDCAAEKEKVMAYFTFDDASYIQHYYVCKGSIIVLFENGSGKAWLVKVDKAEGCEVLRKSMPLIGSFRDCALVDDDNLIIYTEADDENRNIFKRRFETTDSKIMANLYDIKKSYRYFIKDFHTAQLARQSMYMFSDAKGSEYMLLCDPYTDERSKEIYAHEPSSGTLDIRDNIWSISKKRFLRGVKSGKEYLEPKRIASAGTDGLVRFECICGDSIVFRAKKFSTGQEKFCVMSTVNGRVTPVSDVKKRNEKSYYFTDRATGKIYHVFKEDNIITLRGEINSSAVITCPNAIGEISGCIDDRFVLADKSPTEDEPVLTLYDSRLGTTDTFQAHCRTKGNVLVLY